MSLPDNPSKKISTFSRVLAWVFVFCGVLGAAGWIVSIRKHGWPDTWGGTVLMLLSVSVIFPLFLFVAWTGRSPRWMTSMENAVDDELKGRENPHTAGSGMRMIVPVVASVVFGLILIFFGNHLGIFSGETGWFGIVVFAIVWLIVAIVLWRNYRKALSGDPDREADPKR